MYKRQSLDYQETVMAAAGEAAEAALQQAVANPEGFICVVEGAIPTANNGLFGTIGGRTMYDIGKEVLPKAKAVVAYGTCASFGGLPAAGVESLYYLRSYAVVLVIALLGATPLPAKAVQRLRDTSAGSAVLSVAEPVALVLLLALCTAYLVDGSFNPFLYFRF